MIYHNIEHNDFIISLSKYYNIHINCIKLHWHEQEKNHEYDIKYDNYLELSNITSDDEIKNKGFLWRNKNFGQSFDIMAQIIDDPGAFSILALPKDLENKDKNISYTVVVKKRDNLAFINPEEEHIILIKNLLFTNYERKRPERVTPYQLINRLLLLHQEPLIFLFYKKEKGKYKLFFYTHRDIYFKKQFYNDVINKYHTNRVLKNNKPSHIHENYYYFLVNIDRNKITKKVSFSLLNPENEIYKYRALKKIWNALFCSHYSNQINLQSHITKSLDNMKYITDSFAVRQNTLETEDVRNYNSSIPSLKTNDYMFIKNQLKVFESIVDDIYKGFSQSKLISNKCPSNIFFYQRFYGDKETINRYKKPNQNIPGYPYSLKMIIPQTQQRNIKESFKNLFTNSKMNFEKKFFFYKENNDPNNEGEKNEHFPKEEHIDINTGQKILCDFSYLLENEFIKYNRSDHDGKDNILNKIIEVLEKPFSKQSRALIDPCLSSGFIHTRKQLFSSPLSDRLEPILIQKFIDNNIHKKTINTLDFSKIDKMDNIDDLKKIIFLHYFFCMASPSSNINSLGGLFVPLRIGSNNFMAMGTTFIHRKQGEVLPTEWLKNFMFFSSLVDQFIRKLRYKTFPCYKQEVCKVFEDIVIKDLYPAIKPKKGITIDFNRLLFNKKLDNKLDLLCRVWSYEKITIYLLSKNDPNWNNGIHFFRGNKFRFYFKINKNRYFIDEYKRDRDKKKWINTDNLRSLLENKVKQLEKHLEDISR